MYLFAIQQGPYHVSCFSPTVWHVYTLRLQEHLPLHLVKAIHGWGSCWWFLTLADVSSYIRVNINLQYMIMLAIAGRCWLLIALMRTSIVPFLLEVG